MISSVTRPFLTTRYGVWMNPNSETVAIEASEPIRPMFGPSGAQRREAAPVGESGQRVRLVHELRQLRGAEELLQRRDDRTDVDDRLRRDRVHVLGRHPLTDDALHPVETDAERFLDQLTNRAQAAVAEVL